MTLASKSFRVLKTFGFFELIRRVREYAFPPQRMTIRDVALAEVHVVRDACEALSFLAGDKASGKLDGQVYDRYLLEWRAKQEGLNRQSLSDIPPEYDVEARTAEMLYVLVRWRRPQVILETGIARGFSSCALLSAVKANGSGVVHSCDVSQGAGELVDASLRENWVKHIISGRSAKRDFTRVLEDIDSIDLFFHDSNHREGWMEFEFKTVKPFMSVGGVMGSDDIDLNRAFLKIISVSTRSVVLLDSRKASGFAVMDA